jgi:hypothetical protein
MTPAASTTTLLFIFSNYKYIVKTNKYLSTPHLCLEEKGKGGSVDRTHASSSTKKQGLNNKQTIIPSVRMPRSDRVSDGLELRRGRLLRRRRDL